MNTKQYYTKKLYYTIDENKTPLVGIPFKLDDKPAFIDSLTRKCYAITASNTPVKHLTDLKCDILFIGETSMQQRIKTITSQTQLSGDEIKVLKRMISAELERTKFDEVRKSGTACNNMSL